ncbi:hypothetical protein DC58_15720 [Vibrio navarrensis]|uniref:chemotaxis protein CheD n=1 Tax=Vibrio navarrensis TaxID=29495 RepID=UPI00052BA2A0|nr:chemotaxis protein CheD [Vibrio navarrensis]KGK21684.1 hypothetical protein DC58_15720 [Vibrio navarrensis]
MRSSVHQGRTRITIGPGEYHACQQKPIFSTILGSCVATCLWDPVHHVMGMNHFLLANTKNQRRDSLLFSRPGRYGIHAMELLINAMLKKGAERKYLQAKAFGGCNLLDSKGKEVLPFTIGQLNSQFVIEFLKQEKIPLVASSFGGAHARVVYFTPDDNFSVYVKRVGQQNQHALAKQERDFLLQQSQQKSRPIQFW